MTPTGFVPSFSTRIAEKLLELGIKTVPVGNREAVEFIDRPKKFTARLGDHSIDFYNGALANPFCALYLAPTLLGAAIYSDGRRLSGHQLSCEGGILAAFRKQLEPSAYMGMLTEMRRHLINQYSDSKVPHPARFDDYAHGLPASGHDHHRPFYVEHARASLTQILTGHKELPVELVKLLSTSCGNRVFHPFRHSTITPWLEQKFTEIGGEFDFCLVRYQRIFQEHAHRYKQAESLPEAKNLSELNAPRTLEQFESSVAGALGKLERDIERIQYRFGACLDLLLYADDGCAQFHRKHYQNGDEAISALNGVRQAAQITEDPEPPTNSHMLQILTRCTSSMLGCLGHPGLKTSLEINIPDNIAQALRSRFNWFPDDYTAFERFYSKDVSSCLIRFINNLDFKSACSLIVIAPTTTDIKHKLVIPQEIEEPISQHQDLICSRIAERAGMISDSIPVSVSLLGWAPIEQDVQELKRAIAVFLQPESRQFGSPELTKRLGELISYLPLRHSNPDQNNQHHTVHRGFQLASELLLQFGKAGQYYAGSILSSVVEQLPWFRQELCRYIVSCKLLAQDLLTRTPDQLASYESRLLVPIRLYQFLRSDCRKLVPAPTECMQALREIRRGRELRSRLADLESAAETPIHPMKMYDLEKQLEPLRNSHAREHNGDSSIPLATSRSLVQMLKLGNLPVERGIGQLLSEAERVIATAELPELSRPLSLNELYAAESKVMTAMILALRGNHPAEISRNAALAHRFYGIAADKTERAHPKLSASFHELSETFFALSEQLGALKLPENGALNQRQNRASLKVLRRFVQLPSIQTLINDLHIGD